MIKKLKKLIIKEEDLYDKYFWLGLFLGFLFGFLIGALLLINYFA